MAEQLETGFSFDAEPLERGIRALEKFQKSLESSFAQLDRSVQSLTNSLDKFASRSTKATAQVEKAVISSFTNIEGLSKSQARSLDSLTNKYLQYSQKVASSALSTQQQGKLVDTASLSYDKAAMAILNYGVTSDRTRTIKEAFNATVKSGSAVVQQENQLQRMITASQEAYNAVLAQTSAPIQQITASMEQKGVGEQQSAKILADLTAAQNLAAESVRDSGKSSAQAKQAMGLFGAVVAESEQKINSYQQSIKKFPSSQAAVAEELARTEKEAVAVDRAVGQTSASMRTTTSSAEGLARSSDAITKAYKDQRDVKRSSIPLDVQQIKSLQGIDNQYDILVARVEQANLADGERLRLLNNLEASYNRAGDAIVKHGTKSTTTAKATTAFSGAAKDTRIRLFELGKAGLDGESGIGAFNLALQDTTKSVQLALGPLSGVAARITAFSGLFNRNNAAVAVTIGLFTGLTVASRAAFNAFVAYETQVLKVEGVLRSMGAAAQITTQESIELARAFGEISLNSQQAGLDAIAIMSSFRGLARDSFNDILFAAEGLTRLTGGQLKENVRKLARFYEDPVKNFDSLRESGIQINEQERERLSLLRNTFQVQEANLFITKRLQFAIDASTDSAKGFAGQVDTARERIKQITIEAVKAAGGTDAVTEAFSKLNVKLEDIINNQKKLNTLGKTLLVPVNALGKSLEVIIDNFETILTVVTAIGALLVAGSLLRGLLLIGRVAGITTKKFGDLGKSIQRVLGLGSLTVGLGAGLGIASSLDVDQAERLGAEYENQVKKLAQIRAEIAKTPSQKQFELVPLVEAAEAALEKFRNESVTVGINFKVDEGGFLNAVTSAFSRGLDVSTLAVQNLMEGIDLEKWRMTGELVEGVADSISGADFGNSPLIFKNSLEVVETAAKNSAEAIAALAGSVATFSEADKRLKNILATIGGSVDFFKDLRKEFQTSQQVIGEYNNKLSSAKLLLANIGGDGLALAVFAQNLGIVNNLLDEQQNVIQSNLVPAAVKGRKALVDMISAIQENNPAAQAIKNIALELENASTAASRLRADISLVASGGSVGGDTLTPNVRAIQDRVSGIIRGLKPEEIPFVLSAQGVASVEELRKKLQAAFLEVEKLNQLSKVQATLEQTLRDTGKEALNTYQLHLAAIREMKDLSSGQLLDAQQRLVYEKAAADILMKSVQAQAQAAATRAQNIAQPVIQSVASGDTSFSNARAMLQQSQSEMLGPLMGQANELMMQGAGSDDPELLMTQTKLEAIREIYAGHFDELDEMQKAAGYSQLQSVSDSFGTLASAIKAGGGEANSVYKAFAMAQIAISQGIAISKAIADAQFEGAFGTQQAVAALKIAAISIQMGQALASVSRGGFKDGGYVSGPGTSRSDSIPAMLSNKEYVINASAVKSVGLPYLDAINRGMKPMAMPKFKDGGQVMRTPAYMNPNVTSSEAPQSTGTPAQVFVEINDMRGSGSPVEMDRSTDANGNERIKVTVRDAVRQAIASGEMDGMMNSVYGLRRRAVAR